MPENKKVENFEMIPYAKHDGVRTLTDSFIMGLFDRMEKDDTARIVFYDKCVTTREQFLTVMKKPSTYLWVLKVKGDVVGMCWMNNVINKSAVPHWCMFKEYWGKSVDIGIYMHEYILHLKKPNGEYFLDVLTGLVAPWNKKMRGFCNKIGGVEVGLVPKIIWNGYKNQSEDGIYFYYIRQEDRP